MLRKVGTSRELMMMLGVDERLLPASADTALLAELKRIPGDSQLVDERWVVLDSGTSQAGASRLVVGTTEWFVNVSGLKRQGASLAITLGLIITHQEHWTSMLPMLPGLLALVQRLTSEEQDMLGRIAEWAVTNRQYDLGIDEQQLRKSYEEDIAKADRLITALVGRKILKHVANGRIAITF